MQAEAEIGHADEHGVIGGVEPQGAHGDGTELPPRLVQGALILPEAMLPARARRRAA